MSEVEQRTSFKAIASGAGILTIAVLAANGGNYLLNLLLGRWLQPAEFADANLIVTLMLLVTAIAVSLQLVSAKFTSKYDATGAPEKARSLAIWLEKVSLIVGLGFAAILIIGAPFWADFFNSASAWPFVILGLGMPFYLIQSVGRGLLQGRLSFIKLAISFIAEMVIRLSIGLGLVIAGFGVSGATAGLTASFIGTWLVVKTLMGPATSEEKASKPTLEDLGEIKQYIAPVAVLLLGQIIINNGDVLTVKRFFEPEQAGIYSAVALVGRAVFFLSWSAVTALFPAVAQRQEAGESADGLLKGGIAVVGGMCAVMTLGAWIGGDFFFKSVLGEGYADATPLLTKYAIATSMFAIANVVATHHLSSGRYRESWILLAGGIFQTGLLLSLHSNMQQVVNDQLIAMGLLMIIVLVSSNKELQFSQKKIDKLNVNITKPRELVS